MEQFAEIPGFPEYQVSSLGRVFRKAGTDKCINGRELSPWVESDNGYPRVALSRGSCVSKRYVHSIVLIAFVGPRPHKHVARHKDGSRTNVSLSNLEYGTYKENEQDKKRHGTYALCNRPKHQGVTNGI